MINKYNTYKIKIADKKCRKCIALPTMFQDPYEYRMKDVYLAAYSVSNIYKVYIGNRWR